MANCGSVSTLPISCPDGIMGGLEKVWMIAYKDLAPISTATTEVYSASSVNGVVTQVGLATGKTYVEIGLLKSTSGLVEKGQIDDTKGYNFTTQTFTLVLRDITIDNRLFINNVKLQPVSIIYRTRTGKYQIIGLNGQLKVSTYEGGTGVAETDLVGHTLTFEGNSLSTAPFIDDALVKTLVS